MKGFNHFLFSNCQLNFRDVCMTMFIGLLKHCKMHTEKSLVTVEELKPGPCMVSPNWQTSATTKDAIFFLLLAKFSFSCHHQNQGVISSSCQMPNVDSPTPQCHRYSGSLLKFPCDWMQHTQIDTSWYTCMFHCSNFWKGNSHTPIFPDFLCTFWHPLNESWRFFLSLKVHWHCRSWCGLLLVSENLATL